LKNTIPLPAPSLELKTTEDLLRWANKEAIPLLRQLRARLNDTYNAVFELSTAATGAFTSVWTSDAMPTDSAWMVEIRVIGRATAGTDQRTSYVARGTFYNDSGVVAQQGSTSSDYVEESAAGCDFRFAVVGQTVTFDVKDDGASTFGWLAFVSVYPSREV
jgi:hypothetical protein